MSTTTSETDSEEQMNRGYVTVYEQTRDTETHREGERFVTLGYGETKYELVNEGEDDQDFVPQAVPIARIELREPLGSDEYLEEWINSDVGKLSLSHFFNGIDAPDILTPYGRDKTDFDQEDDA